MRLFFAVVLLLAFIVVGLVLALDFRGAARAFARRSLEQARPLAGRFIRKQALEEEERRLAWVVVVQRIGVRGSRSSAPS